MGGAAESISPSPFGFPLLHTLRHRSGGRHARKGSGAADDFPKNYFVCGFEKTPSSPYKPSPGSHAKGDLVVGERSRRQRGPQGTAGRLPGGAPPGPWGAARPISSGGYPNIPPTARAAAAHPAPPTLHLRHSKSSCGRCRARPGACPGSSECSRAFLFIRRGLEAPRRAAAPPPNIIYRSHLPLILLLPSYPGSHIPGSRVPVPGLLPGLPAGELHRQI